MKDHTQLTEPSLQMHPRKGREGKGNRNGELRDEVPIHRHLGDSSSPASMDGRFAESIAVMFEHAPNDWWRFVPCRTCNASRQLVCMAIDGPARRPHAARVRSGLVLHGTLWLIANGYAQDVIGGGRP